MDLYGNLPPPADEADQAQPAPHTSSWHAPALQPPPRRPVLAPAALLRPARTAASAPAAAPRLPAPVPPQSKPLLSTPSEPTLLSEVADEYRPGQPNSYDDVVRSRSLRRKQDELEEKRRALERQRNGLETRRAPLGGAPLPPPPPLSQSLPPPPPLPVVAADERPAALRMMEAMGWRAGSGLGREEDGITAPLQVRRTSRHSGVVLHPPARRAAPTSVLCLRGLCPIGGVDAQLEDEVSDECERCGGPVVRVLIFEPEAVADSGDPLAIRIFVEFQEPAAAAKAHAALGGRFFGGCRVVANFIDPARLEQGRFAPEPGEFGDVLG